MTPVTVLEAAGLPLDLVEEAIPHVDLARVRIRPAPAWLRRAWRRDVTAMATPWAVFVLPSLLRAQAGSVAGLLVHELAHVEQWRRMGVAAFLWRYLADYLHNRRRGMGHQAAYLAISLEQEAESVRRYVIGHAAAGL